jgi:hypothetical protein
MRRSRRRVVVSAASLLLGAACQSAVDSTSIERSAAPVALLHASKPVTLVVGQTTRLLSNHRVDGGEWRTENPSVALVGSDGTVSPTQPGTTRIIHRSDSAVDTIAVTVRDPVDSVHLGADLLNVRVGRTTKLPMRAFDNGGTVPASTDLNATWESTDPSVAAVDDQGVLTATGVGCASVVVNVDTKADTESVSVLPQPGMASVTLPNCAPKLTLRWTSALPTSLHVGQTTQISAVSASAISAIFIPNAPVSFSSSDASIADVNSGGLVRGTGPGDAILTATSGSQSISTDLSVLALPQVAVSQVNVTLSRSNVTVGDSVQATATVLAEDGNPISGMTISWSVPAANASVVSIDASGKVKSTGAGTAQIMASVEGVNGAAALVVAPASAAAPVVGQTPIGANPDGAAAVLALMGPTIKASQTPSSLSWYENNFKSYSDIQWAAFGPRWDAGNSNAGYDRAAINFVWWARTGDTTYLNRAHAIAQAYRTNYLVPALFGTSPHWSQVEGLYLDWIVTGDEASRDAVLRIANMFIAYDQYLDNPGITWMENRVQTRVLLAFWMAEKIQGVGSPWTARLNAAIPRLLSTQAPDGHWGFISTCGGSWNFMTGLLTDALSRMYDQRSGNGGSNPAILTSLTKAANYLWDTQWRQDQSFNYASAVCEDGGGPTAAPDLNGLILPVFGWLGKTTGDASWFTKGDVILNSMTQAYIEEYKQLSESYTSSYRYLGYRYGF